MTHLTRDHSRKEVDPLPVRAQALEEAEEVWTLSHNVRPLDADLIEAIAEDTDIVFIAEPAAGECRGEVFELKVVTMFQDLLHALERKVFGALDIHEDEVEVRVLVVLRQTDHFDLYRLVTLELEEVRLVKAAAAASGVHLAGEKLDLSRTIADREIIRCDVISIV